MLGNGRGNLLAGRRVSRNQMLGGHASSRGGLFGRSRSNRTVACGGDASKYRWVSSNLSPTPPPMPVSLSTDQKARETGSLCPFGKRAYSFFAAKTRTKIGGRRQRVIPPNAERWQAAFRRAYLCFAHVVHQVFPCTSMPSRSHRSSSSGRCDVGYRADRPPRSEGLVGLSFSRILDNSVDPPNRKANLYGLNSVNSATIIRPATRLAANNSCHSLVQGLAFTLRGAFLTIS
jgi:hypothetical protein